MALKDIGVHYIYAMLQWVPVMKNMPWRYCNSKGFLRFYQDKATNFL